MRLIFWRDADTSVVFNKIALGDATIHITEYDASCYLAVSSLSGLEPGCIGELKVVTESVHFSAKAMIYFMSFPEVYSNNTYGFKINFRFMTGDDRPFEKPAYVQPPETL